MKAMRPASAFSGGGAPRRMSATYQAATGSATRRSRRRRRRRRGAARAPAHRRRARGRHRGASGRSSVMPSPPSPTASPAGASFGSAIVAPPCRSRAMKRAGPTSARSSTAGTLSDSCSARRAVTVPWKARSKFSGCIGAEARRPVVDEGLGMGDAVLEGERVDERLQRRSGRAQRRASCRPRRRGRATR